MPTSNDKPGKLADISCCIGFSFSEGIFLRVAVMVLVHNERCDESVLYALRIFSKLMLPRCSALGLVPLEPGICIFRAILDARTGGAYTVSMVTLARD